ncbi:uncharacterized protein [Anoplolepis gracilipes]|uniref:uncharacterized protein n=1 Tax=Anoplolepis gracilipes TaxID=354296 RepID=UPI003B9F59E4
MKLFARPKCLTEAIAPVITLNRLVGLRAFEYPPGQPRPILSLIYLLLLYFLYCIYLLIFLKIEYSLKTRVILQLLLYSILEYVNITFVSIKLLLGWWHSKKFEACYKKLSEIDETLRQLGAVVNYDRMYFTIIGVIIIWFIFNFSVCIMMNLIILNGLDPYLFVTIAVRSNLMTIDAIVIFELYIFIKCLEMRFDLINRLLREHLAMSFLVKEVKLGFFELQDYAKIMNVEQRRLFPIKILSQWCRQVQSHFPSYFQKQFQEKHRNRSQKHNFVKTKCQKRKYLLQIIKQVHLELCKVSKTVCTIFGVQTACEIGMIIIFLTEYFYSLYIRYYKKQELADLIAMLSFLQILLNFFKITFLSRVCKHATDKGTKTMEIIYSIHGYDKESDVKEEIQQFGIQILQSRLKFSAFGIPLDNVLTMILKVITTYLIIMIQMNNSLEKMLF